MTSDEELERAKDLAHYQHQLDAVLEVNKVVAASVVTYGAAVLRGAFLLNGAAAVALLSQLHAVTNDMGSVYLRPQIAGVLLLFAWGAFAAVVTTGVTYVCQFIAASFTDRPWAKRAFAASMTVAVVGILISGALFIYGACRAAAMFGGQT